MNVRTIKYCSFCKSLFYSVIGDSSGTEGPSSVRSVEEGEGAKGGSTANESK